ncbi:MAG: CBS domain-containing protein [Candidatus Omnitrophica bacterium]|nr:CBS domain-containing protein [Candidatus Omnitrophota bacterium]
MFKKKYLGIITGDVVTADEKSSAADICRLMGQHDIGVVVIMKDSLVVGIVSERDIARRVCANNLSAENTMADSFMTREVVSVEIKDGLNNIYKTLCEMKFRHLVIMDRNKLVGITSRRDLLDVLVGRKSKGMAL